MLKGQTANHPLDSAPSAPKEWDTEHWPVARKAKITPEHVQKVTTEKSRGRLYVDERLTLIQLQRDICTTMRDEYLVSFIFFSCCAAQVPYRPKGGGALPQFAAHYTTLGEAWMGLTTEEEAIDMAVKMHWVLTRSHVESFKRITGKTLANYAQEVIMKRLGFSFRTALKDDGKVARGCIAKSIQAEASNRRGNVTRKHERHGLRMYNRDPTKDAGEVKDADLRRLEHDIGEIRRYTGAPSTEVHWVAVKRTDKKNNKYWLVGEVSAWGCSVGCCKGCSF